MKIPTAAFTLGLAVLSARPSKALTILLDYSHDAATDNYFNTHPVARAALEQARDDLQGAITTMLGAITNDVTTGTSGSTTANYNFSYSYTNPSTGSAQSIAIATTAADAVTIFVGMRELGGATIGQGGPGSLGTGVNGGGLPSEWPAAMAAANAAATAERLRGGGPTIGVLSGIVTLGGTPATVQVEYGSAIGNLWFDNDRNNDGFADSDVQMDASWHFDHTIPVAGGKSDFYSVALHELIHVLGMGTSATWNNQRSGANWFGAEVIARHGTGAGLLDPSGGHIADGVTSPRLSDGLSQEVVMSPSLTTGTRKTLTELDLAFLRDLNWTTAGAIPEPATWTLVFAAAGLLQRRRR